MMAQRVPPVSDGKSGHLAFVDGLRACAALYVVIYHAALQGTSPIPPGSVAGFVGPFFHYGRFAVDVFIVLSGFCLALPIVRRERERGEGKLANGVWAFYRARARRILPPYYGAMTLSCLLIVAFVGRKTGTNWDNSLPITARGVVSHLFLAQDLYPDTFPNVNYAFWSIAVEWRIYLLFPLLLWFRRRFGTAKTTLAVIGLTVLLFLGSALTSHTRLPSIMPQFFALFTMGMLAAEWGLMPGERIRRWRDSPALSYSLAFSAVLMLTAIVVLPWRYSVWFLQDMLMGVPTALLLVRLMARPPSDWLRRFFSLRPLAFVGMFSYSIYLIHAPLLQVLYQTLFVGLQKDSAALFAAYCFVGLPLILVASYAFFYVFERPFLRSNRRTLPASTTDTVSAPAP